MKSMLFSVLAVSVAVLSSCSTVQTKPQDISSVSHAASEYMTCIKSFVAERPWNQADPYFFADAATGSCEPYLVAYKIKVFEYYSSNLSTSDDFTYYLMLTEPESRANRLREKTKAAIMAHLFEDRK